MRTTAENFAFLKDSLARVGLEGAENPGRVALGHSPADTALGGGLAQGVLHEIFPARAGDDAAATGFAVALAARVAIKKRVLWIMQDFATLEQGEISALGLLELGVDPARFVLLRAPDSVSVLRAASDALTCRALGTVILEIPGTVKSLDLSASRRLVLASAQSGVTVVLLRCSAQPEASAAETRWLVRAGRAAPDDENWGRPLFEAALVRHRRGRSGEWLMEWNGDDGLFRAPNSGAVVSTPGDRPSAAEGTRATLSRAA